MLTRLRDDTSKTLLWSDLPSNLPACSATTAQPIHYLTARVRRNLNRCLLRPLTFQRHFLRGLDSPPTQGQPLGLSERRVPCTRLERSLPSAPHPSIQRAGQEGGDIFATRGVADPAPNHSPQRFLRQLPHGAIAHANTAHVGYA